MYGDVLSLLILGIFLIIIGVIGFESMFIVLGIIIIFIIIVVGIRHSILVIKTFK